MFGISRRSCSLCCGFTDYFLRRNQNLNNSFKEKYIKGSDQREGRGFGSNIWNEKLIQYKKP